MEREHAPNMICLSVTGEFKYKEQGQGQQYYYQNKYICTLPVPCTISLDPGKYISCSVYTYLLKCLSQRLGTWHMKEAV